MDMSNLIRAYLKLLVEKEQNKFINHFKKPFITEIYRSTFDQNNTAVGVLGIIFEVDAPRIYETDFNKKINCATIELIMYIVQVKREYSNLYKCLGIFGV
jgi:hypothetical protein